MKDDLARDAAADGDDGRIRTILDEICALTGMGFAAVARVTDDRWIACQVADRIAFGLDPGDELDVKTTICDDIRRSGRAIVIDEVSADATWRTHHTPILYGFQSYASLPIVLDDDSFYGTLCAIDAEPHKISAADMVAQLRGYAAEVASILSKRRAGAAT